MDKTPPPLALAAARALPLPPNRRSAEVFRDGDLEIRFYAPPGTDPQTPHDRDELYVVASGNGQFRVGDVVTPVSVAGSIAALRSTAANALSFCKRSMRSFSPPCCLTTLAAAWLC